jgi:membrane-bound serine protease (ClpP class)
MRRLLVALLVLVALAGARDAAAATGPVVVLDVKGAIGPATTDYLARGLGEAREAQAAAVVLRMDTPGGLDRSMREIIHLILASPVPVIAYVAPSGARAASAGTYILYASHLAAMAPATNLGAATPIQLGGAPQPLGGGKGDEKDGDKGEEGAKKRAPETAEAAKAVNDAVAYIRGLARLRGRNAEWAESAVREAASLPAEEALQKGVIELIAPDLSALLAAADGRKVSLEGKEATLATKGAEIRLRPPSWRTELLAAITDPNVALILMLIGIYGIIFEFMSPGMVLPGVLGAIALLVGLFALNTLPINYAGAGLVLLGLAFMAAEAFVPSFGVLGIGGAVAFVIGIIMMFDFGEAPGFELAPGVAIGAGIASAVFFIVVIAAVARSRRRAVVTGSEQLIGSIAEVISADGGTGRVHIHGEAWQARGAAEALVPGARVRVKARDGLVLLVERAKE